VIFDFPLFVFGTFKNRFDQNDNETQKKRKFSPNRIFPRRNTCLPVQTPENQYLLSLFNLLCNTLKFFHSFESSASVLAASADKSYFGG
jgi:hypothetical protein